MLLPVPMKKIVAVVHKSRKDEILKVLKDKGVVEIRDADESDLFEKLSLDRGKSSWMRIEASENISKIDGILDVLKQVSKVDLKLSSLGEYEELIKGIPSNKDEISKAFEEIAEKLFFLDEKVGNLNNNLNNIRKEMEEFESYGSILEKLEKFNLGPRDLRGFKKTYAFFGIIPKEHIESVKEELNRKLPVYILESRDYDKKRDIVILIVHSEHETDVTRILRIHQFEEIGIPLRIIPYTLEEARVKIEENLKELKDEEKEILKELGEIASKEIENLLKYREFLSAVRKLDEINTKFATTRDTYIFQGWVPADKVNEVKRLIEDVSNGECIIEIREPSHGDKPPTLIKNPKVTKPLEVLTKSYGYPGYDELDPTSIIAITFPVIFGFMFGDIGHGLVVALLGYTLGFKLNLGEDARKLGRTLLLCGISAFIVGWLYGSLFGLEGHYMAKYLGFELETLRMNPMSNIQSAVIFSLKFGVVLLSLAIFLNIVKLSLHKEYKHAFVHPFGFAGLWLFLGAVALLFKYGIDFGAILGSQLSFLLLYLPLLIIITGEWKVGGEGLGMSIFNTFFEVVLKYLANGLSFVRISILALVHGGLASMMVMGMDIFSNPVLIGIVFILGNVVIIVMEMFISFIHDLRLHFYEIFSKFYSGNGVPFNPLKISFKFLERE